MKTYYEILEIEKTASKDEIKNSYKKLALKYHPDRNQDYNKKEQCEDKFKEISEAYEILSDDEKKKNYDKGQNVVLHNNPFDTFQTTFNFNPFKDNIFDININGLSNINISHSNIQSNIHSTSINTTTQIINNKKITKIQKTIQTPNGTQTIIEEHTETI